MTTRKPISIILATALLAAPVTASAQFGGLGGLGKKLLGGGSDAGVSSADAGTFLNGAMKSTKNVMISAALLAQALQNKGDLASRKAYIDAIDNAQNFGELSSQTVTLKADLAALSSRQDLTSDLTTAYQSGTAQQKQIIGTAIANLALGIFRNVRLAGAAPGMISSIGTNPQLMTRAGEFKTAASMLGVQAKSFGTIGTTLPKIMGAMKIKPLPEAETTEPVPVTL